MKKTLLLLFAFVASISGAWAQETNYALNKQAYASSYFAAENNYIANANDGNEGTRWANNRGDASEGNPHDVENPYWYVDLGSVVEFNTIEIVFVANQRPTSGQIVTGTGDNPTSPSWSETPIVTITSAPNTTETYELETQHARYIKISATAFNDAYGIGINEFRVYNREPLHFASVSVSPAYFPAGTSQTVTASPLDQYGNAFSSTYTYNISPSEGVTNNANGTFTFSASAVAGSYTVSVTDEGGDTYTAQVYSVGAPTPPTDDSDKVLAVFSKTYGVESPSISDPSWNGKYGTATKMNLSSENTSYIVTNCGEFGFNVSGANVTEYKYLHASVFSLQDYEGNVSHGNEGTLGLMILKGGQWNDVIINIEGNTISSFDWLFFRPGPANVSTNTIVITDVYFSKEDAAIPFDITSDGIVTGDVTPENVAVINVCTSAVINLSSAIVKEAITITPANTNAVVVVSGTGRTPNESGAKVTASNIVVFDGTWYRAKDGVEITITDADNAQPDYGFTIDAQQDGYKITRTIPARKYVTTVLPATIAAAQLTGVNVYELKEASSNEITFEKKDASDLTANTPYVLYSESETTLTATKTGDDLNLTSTSVGAVTKDEVTFQGTFAPITTVGSQYILSNNNFKKGNGAKIGAFRAYFTGVSAGANARAVFIDRDATKIGTITAEGEIESVEDGVYYNLNGQRVTNPKHGIFIVNGKKVFVK